MTDLVPPPAGTPSESPVTAEFELRPLLRKLAAVLGLLSVGGLAVAWFVREEIEAIGGQFVDAWGVWGVALAFFVPDATGLPIPPDGFTMLALHGGMDFWTIVAFGSLGSVAGGCVAYAGSQLLRRVPSLHAKLEARAGESKVFIERYGVLALALGALTPLPYSLVAWTCGVLGMPFRPFVLVSLLRIPRVALYLLPMWLPLQ